MALPLGKLTIIVGAGLVGSVLAKDARMPSIPGFVSGAFKDFFRRLGRDDSSASAKKPRSDNLIAQVNSLREELQILASHRSVTIITTGGKGTGKYGMIVVVLVIGYGYIWWWKGWKLSDMTFATTRSLNDARKAIAEQLTSVYSSISETRRDLSSKIYGVDTRLNEIIEATTTTNDEASQLQRKSESLSTNVHSVRSVVQNLEDKISRIEGKQVVTTAGVGRLLYVARNLQESQSADHRQALPSSSSNRAAIELPPLTPTSRSGSLPPPQEASSSLETSSSSRNVSNSEISSSSNEAVADAEASPSEVRSRGFSFIGFFGSRVVQGFRPSERASLLTRTHSATGNFTGPQQ